MFMIIIMFIKMVAMLHKMLQ